MSPRVFLDPHSGGPAGKPHSPNSNGKLKEQNTASPIDLPPSIHDIASLCYRI